MNSISSSQNVAAMAPADIPTAMESERQRQERTRNFLYQAATILAILLFLISV